MEELQGDFALNKHGWFTVQNVAENDFLNSKLENDTYGIWYSVQFSGNAETFLWQTKTAPIEGEKYWGWLETTKSGKSVKFKWDKHNAPTTSSSPQNQSQGSYDGHSDKEDSIARAVSLKAAVEFVIGNGDPKLTVLDVADQYLTWLKNSGSPRSREGTPPQVTQASQNPDSAVGQKRDWSKVGQGEPLPLPPDDINDIEPGDYQ